MKPHINTIIFDLGGVLVDWNPMYLYTKLFKGDEQKATWFIENVCTHQWNIAQDGGRTIAEAEALKIAEFPEYEELIKQYYSQWHLMFSGAIQENVNLFQTLRASKKYKIYALTNWGAETWPRALELFPFLNDFDGVVVSGIEKTRKPFPEIYQIILDRYQITPEKSIFMDDNLDNVKAAKEFGIQAIQCKNPQQLKEDLKNYIDIE